MKKYLLILILTLLTTTVSFADSQTEGNSEKSIARILVLHSAQYAHPQSDAIVSGMQSVFAIGTTHVELYVEYMDAQRFDSQKIYSPLQQFYSQKYNGLQFSTIVVTGNSALDFIQKYHHQLFPHVPVISYGIDNAVADQFSEEFPYFEIQEISRLRNAIAQAQSYNPNLQHLVVVGDTHSFVDENILEEDVFRKIYGDTLSLERRDDLSFQVSSENFKNIETNSVVIFAPSYGASTLDQAQMLADIELLGSQNIPMIFTGQDVGDGLGPLDHGLLYLGQSVGHAIQTYLASGEFPVQGKLLITPPYIVDHNFFQKFKVVERKVPSGPVVLPNQQEKLDEEESSSWAIIAIILLVVLLALVAGFLVLLSRLRESRNENSHNVFQENLLETVPLLICWKDCENKYLGANSAFTNFFGIAGAENILGCSDKEIGIDPSFADYAEKLEIDVVKSAKPLLRVRQSYIDREGKPVWLEINKIPLFDKEGQVIGTLSTAEDISIRVNLERQLIQAQKFEAIGTLTGGISHDFNNILASIVNSVELAITDVQQDSATWKDLDRARKAAYRGSHLVKQILTFSSRAEDGFKAINVTSVIQETIDFITASFPKNIDVKYSVPAHVPIIIADATQIHQIIMNLCTNSFQSIKSSGGLIEVLLSTTNVDQAQARKVGVVEGKYLKLDIRDDGPGIPEDIVGKIFDPFVTTKSKSEGTGLGLSIVHSLVEGHGGGVTVASVPGVHTTFSIYLPVKGVREERKIADKDIAPQGEEHILFVEDDEEQLVTTPRILERLGYKVVATKSPVEAYKMLMKTPKAFQLVISDYDMPEMTGVELSNKLNKVAPYLPVMIVSGRRNIVEHTSKSSNIVKVVLKPYTKNSLAVGIREALAKAGHIHE